MKIYLTGEQHSKLLDLIDPEHNKKCRAGFCRDKRKELVNEMFPKLKYTEAKYIADKSYYGAVTGLPKDVSWFLLHI